jgi:hypothetical protein
MDPREVAAREDRGEPDRSIGASYPLELARRAIAAERAAEAAPLDDPWFIDEGPASAAEADPSYDAWVTRMESYVPPPPLPSTPSRIASQLASLFFL